LSDLVALERLKVHSQVSDVSAVAALRGLKELHLASAALLALPPLRELSRLEKVQLDYCRALPEVSFKGCAALRTLSLGYLHALRALDLTGCTALETLILNGSPSLDVVRGLETLTKLKRIVAESASGPWINHGELPELPSLEDLRLTWFPRADTAFASRLTALKSLSLRGAANLQDLSGLAALGALESLDLRNCGKVSDLTALAGLTKLREVLLHGTAVDRKALPKHLQRVAR
jgi:Leucine-rich repeat (LRR) protein